MVCTCGRMRRPCGAPESSGTTSSSVPCSGSRSCTSGGCFRAPAGARRASAARMPSSPQPSRAEAQSTGTVAARPSGRHAASQVSAVPRLLTTTAKGMPAAARRAAVSASTASQQGASSTSRATSTRRMARRLRSTRWAPSEASRSSSPAVSRKTTGPRGAISSVFSTGSAVLPGVGETMATS